MTFCNFWTKSKSLKSLNKISFHEHTPTHTLPPILCLHTNTRAHSHLLAPTCPNTNLQLHLLTHTCSQSCLHAHAFYIFHPTQLSHTCYIALSLSVLCCPHILDLTLKLPGHISQSEMPRIFHRIALKFSQVLTCLSYLVFISLELLTLSFTHTHINVLS